VLFFQILQVPRADLEKVGNLGAGEKAVSHGFIFPFSLCVMRATSSRDRCVRMPSPIFLACGALLELSFASPQRSGQPPKGSRGRYIGAMVSDSAVGVLRSVIGLIHNDRHAGAIDRQYNDCA
jgi:hypothetical protein